MAGGPQTQWKNHVKFYAISGLNSSRRNPGRGVEKCQKWPAVRLTFSSGNVQVSGQRAGEANFLWEARVDFRFFPNDNDKAGSRNLLENGSLWL
jgi:hypothetical protein